MAGEARVILENARLGADPEQKQSQSGQPYLSMRFAITPYRKNRQTNQYEDGETEWWQATEFDTRQMETYMHELHKGDSIRVEGVLNIRLYQDKQGQTQISREVRFAHISKNLPKAKQQQQGFQPNYGQQNYGQPNYSQGVQNYGQPANPMTPAYGAAQASQTAGQSAVDPWSQPQTPQTPQASAPQDEFGNDEF